MRGREAGGSSSFARAVVFSVYLRIYGRSAVSFLHQVSIFLAGAAVSINIHLLTNSARARLGSAKYHRGTSCRVASSARPPSTRCLQRLIVFVRKFGKRFHSVRVSNATFLTSAGDRQTSRIPPGERANFAPASSRPAIVQAPARKKEKIDDSSSFQFEAIASDVMEKHVNSEPNKADIKISFSKRQTCPTMQTISKHDGDR